MSIGDYVLCDNCGTKLIYDDTSGNIVRPDWQTAPAWANYIAIDVDNNWWWVDWIAEGASIPVEHKVLQPVTDKKYIKPPYGEKPKWENSPEWAKYLSMDNTGNWFWYENKPEDRDGFWHTESGRFEYAGCTLHTDTLEERS